MPFNSFMTETVIIETSPLIWGENQWTSFYMITASVMKELIHETETLLTKVSNYHHCMSPCSR